MTLCGIRSTQAAGSASLGNDTARQPLLKPRQAPRTVKLGQPHSAMPYRISDHEMARFVELCKQANVDLPSAEHLEAHTPVAEALSGCLTRQPRLDDKGSKRCLLLVFCQAWQVINVVRDVRDGASSTGSWSQAWSATAWGLMDVAGTCANSRHVSHSRVVNAALHTTPGTGAICTGSCTTDYHDIAW